MRTIGFLLLTIPLFLIISCKKRPGPGGNSSIAGKVFVKDYNTSFTTLVSKYYGQAIYVYLIYGDDISYSKSVKTSYDGTFEFKYLRQGNYTVYTFSKDSTMQAPDGKIPVVRKVDIAHKKQKVELGDLVIFN